MLLAKKSIRWFCTQN